MEITWSEFKRIVDKKSLPIQWVEIGDNYHCAIADGHFLLNCLLPKGVDNADTIAFETTYKDKGNVSVKSTVETQFERKDLSLKIAKVKGDVDSNGEVTLELKIPGTFSGTTESVNGRFLSGGLVFFNEWHPGDVINYVQLVDKDNVIGLGANAVIRRYNDTDVAEENSGYFVPPGKQLHLKTLGFYGFIPSGLYIKLSAKKGASQTTGTFYCNIHWAKLG